MTSTADPRPVGTAVDRPDPPPPPAPRRSGRVRRHADTLARLLGAAAAGGLLVADSALTPEWVSRTIPDLLTDTERLATMSAAAANLIPLDADEKLADLIEAAVESGPR